MEAAQKRALRRRCPECGVGEEKIVREPFEAYYGRELVRLEDVEMLRCDSCREVTFTSQQARRLSERIREEIRRRHQLLSPQEIRQIRERLGLTQRELERLMGLGPKVVVRWEAGRVLQSRAADVALRLLERFPEAVEVLRRLRDETPDKVA